MDLQNIKDRLDNNLLVVVLTKDYHSAYTIRVEGRLSSLRTQIPQLNTHIDHYITTLYFKTIEAYEQSYYFNNKDIIITYNRNKESGVTQWYLHHNLSNIKSFKFGELDANFNPQQDYIDNDYVFYNTNRLVGNISLYYRDVVELDNDIVTYLELEKHI